MGKTVLRKKHFLVPQSPLRFVEKIKARVQFAGVIMPFVLAFAPLIGKAFTIL
jgi:hypothetical protein